VTESSETQRLSVEGADLLTLAGVHDANLAELQRVSNARVSLRGDTLTLAGPADAVHRAAAVAQRMIDMARQGVPLTPDDVLRLSLDTGRDGDGGAETEGRLALPGVRRLIQAKTSGQAEYMRKDRRERRRDRHRPGGHGQDVPGRGDGRSTRSCGSACAASCSRARGRGRREPRLPSRRHAGEGRPVPAAALRRARRDDAAGARRQGARDALIEIAPLAFMRGRTLGDAFVILDEAQNATNLQMKMFLTRLGVNSKIVITGDKTQIDLPKREDSGLMQVERILHGIEGISFHYFSDADVVRHRLVREIIKAYADDAGD
jgi:phosphate starvation-inducible PhoH-like protein